MVIIFSLDRPDILPVGDLDIQNGMKKLYQIDVGNKKDLIIEIEKIAEKWIPYRTYASRYIWDSGNMD